MSSNNYSNLNKNNYNLQFHANYKPKFLEHCDFELDYINQNQNHDFLQKSEELSQEINMFLYGTNELLKKKQSLKNDEELRVRSIWQKSDSKVLQQEKQQHLEENKQESKEENSLSDDSFDEDMLLEQVICCESEKDMIQFIEINEMRCPIMKPNYSKLYQKLKKRAVMLMSILKKKYNAQNKENSNNKFKDYEIKNKELQFELDKYKNVYNNLNKKLTNQYGKYATLEGQYVQLKANLEELENQNNFFNEPSVLKIDLQKLIQLEKKTQKTLQQISEKKSEIIEQLQNRIKQQHDSHKSMCVICQEKPINCLLQPCCHACCCDDCAQGLDQCPMDRQLFTSIKKIYLS
ncbi:zinc finger, C3HC4 type (RING finger) protein (macronuclear) [Tetrahymena thermophila SB210]|uniref:Zinc finger, C3HC4 type (RING finger) protein n=1 Tax=Tetrahymena thermophila (strain SB210) TaxID=312017 RepID=I7M9T8_TETTS|nr:zinc finger, C3HC4 type (RING finger) protein [Tetrahymena thermophila SB210]EAS02793.1 zinc finger, C3HC4 type (RING finger) protein [Tetrahymena thermophila SB210]|eukprot:XP_001023038.1 zinc finger, C3HC4 type (RING finger) protein [Tetrahymena thermophila SB210]